LRTVSAVGIGVKQEKSGAEPHAPFDKVVFMVVDALRSDFVFGEDSAMAYVQRYVCLAALGLIGD
jgi:ethanolaminephosphotransferase